MALPVSSSARPVPNNGVNGGRPVYANQMSDGARGLNVFNAKAFRTAPLTLNTSAGGVPALPTAGAAQVNQVYTPFGMIEMYQQTAQTLLPRLVAASESKGLEVALDQVNNETVEYVPGGNYIGSPYAYTVGTSAPATFRVSLEIEDADGMDQMVIGWRKVQAYQAAAGFITAVDPLYTDFAAIGFAGAVANPNPLRVITDLNDTGTPVITALGFTWADGLIHTLEVRVTGRRALYFINGKRLGDTISKDGLGNTITSQSPITPPAFSFDVGDVLVPFAFFRQDAALSPAYLSSTALLGAVYAGPLSELGLDPSNLQGL